MIGPIDTSRTALLDEARARELREAHPAEIDGAERVDLECQVRLGIRTAHAAFPHRVTTLVPGAEGIGDVEDDGRSRCEAARGEGRPDVHEPRPEGVRDAELHRARAREKKE